MNPKTDVSEFEREVVSTFGEGFGFESWRSKLWGHDVMAEIGCCLLNSLKHTYIYAFDNDIKILKRDLHKVIDNIDLIEKKTHIPKEMIQERVDNALERIRVAENHSDKIGICIG